LWAYQASFLVQGKREMVTHDIGRRGGLGRVKQPNQGPYGVLAGTGKVLLTRGVKNQENSGHGGKMLVVLIGDILFPASDKSSNRVYSTGRWVTGNQEPKIFDESNRPQGVKDNKTLPGENCWHLRSEDMDELMGKKEVNCASIFI